MIFRMYKHTKIRCIVIAANRKSRIRKRKRRSRNINANTKTNTNTKIRTRKRKNKKNNKSEFEHFGNYKPIQKLNYSPLAHIYLKYHLGETPLAVPNLSTHGHISFPIFSAPDSLRKNLCLILLTGLQIWGICQFFFELSAIFCPFPGA